MAVQRISTHPNYSRGKHRTKVAVERGAVVETWSGHIGEPSNVLGSGDADDVCRWRRLGREDRDMRMSVR